MNGQGTAQPSPLGARDFQILNVGRDWCDVRLEIPFDQARKLLLESLPPIVDDVDTETGELRASHTVRDWAPQGRLGYKKGCEVVGPPTSGSIKLMGEHPSAKGWSMFSASRNCADFVWEMIEQARPRNVRDLQPPQVNRVDYAIDFRFPADRSEELFAAALDIADLHDIRRYREGTPGEGETFFFNWSKQAEYRKTRTPSLPIHSARLYQKGFEQGALIVADNGPDCDWWRYEGIYRPDKPISKEAGFRYTADDILGATKWGQSFLDLIGYEGVSSGVVGSWPEKVDVTDEKARRAKCMRTLAHMGDQYAKAAQEMATLVGWDRVDQMVLEMLRTERSDESPTRPGDRLRTEADLLWCDRFDPRFQRRPMPVLVVDNDQTDEDEDDAA